MNPPSKVPAKHPEPTPVSFPQANFTYTKPSNMTDEECGALPCFRNETMAISCWRFPLKDRLRLLLIGDLWLTVLGSGHPPVAVGSDSPFNENPRAEKITRRFVTAVALGVVGALVLGCVLLAVLK